MYQGREAASHFLLLNILNTALKREAASDSFLIFVIGFANVGTNLGNLWEKQTAGYLFPPNTIMWRALKWIIYIYSFLLFYILYLFPPNTIMESTTIKKQSTISKFTSKARDQMHNPKSLVLIFSQDLLHKSDGLLETLKIDNDHCNDRRQPHHHHHHQHQHQQHWHHHWWSSLSAWELAGGALENGPCASQYIPYFIIIFLYNNFTTSSTQLKFWCLTLKHHPQS